MINENGVYAFCCEDISKIENYDKAMADITQVWHCHHRAEVLPCGRFSRATLKKFGLYYNQPADRLIFMTSAAHRRLHCAGIKLWESTKKKISLALTGKKQSPEIIAKRVEKIKGRKNPKAIIAMRKARLGSHNTAEANEANRRAHLGNNHWLGRHHTKETKKKLSELRKGKGCPHTQAAKDKIANARFGRRWFTNGKQEVCTKSCPEGFVPGRLKK